MTQLTDENGKIQTITYNDPNFWRPMNVQDFGGVNTGLAYTAASGGTPASVESSMNFTGTVSTADGRTTLDGLGRVQINQRKQGPSSTNYDSVEQLYDTLGRLSQVSMPYVGAASQLASSPVMTTYSYDALGRPKQIVDGGNGNIQWGYASNDVTQTVTSPGTNKVRQFEYDGLGRLSSVCELTSGIAFGNCAQVAPQSGYWTRYAYNALNNLTSVSQNAQSTTSNQSRVYQYDMLGRVTLEQNPETNNLSYSYVYDSDATCGTSHGDMVKRTDAVGNVTCYAYDKMHRLTGVTHPNGAYAANTPARCFVYDTATVNGQAMQNAKARLAEAYTTASVCTGAKLTDVGFSYSDRGEVQDVYESTPHSGVYYHVTTTHWENGLVKALSSSLTGLPTIYYGAANGSGLDGEGRITKVTASSGQSPVIGSSGSAGVTYNNSDPAKPIGALTGVTFGSSDSDTFQYDFNTGRLTQYKFNVGTSNSVTGNLGWNADGTLATLGITDTLNAANSQSCTYTYDDLARLASANCGIGVQNQTFAYDPYGNITKTVPQGSQGWSFQSAYSATTTATNWLTQIGSLVPTYDNNGNLTNDTVHSYTWDAEGKMLSVDATVVALTYDALGRMVEQNRSGVYKQIVYAPTGGKLALMSGQTLSKAFIPLPAGATAVYTASGLAYYRHSDWLGTSRLATTPSRTKYYDGAYAPFGENYAGSGTTDLNFTGQNQDTVANYYDFLFRQYSMVQGRWMSPDPAGLSTVNPANPQSWNRYAYVMNGPLNSVDPVGLYTNPGPGPNPPPPMVNPFWFGGGICSAVLGYICDLWAPMPMMIDGKGGKAGASGEFNGKPGDNKSNSKCQPTLKPPDCDFGLQSRCDSYYNSRVLDDNLHNDQPIANMTAPYLDPFLMNSSPRGANLAMVNQLEQINLLIDNVALGNLGISALSQIVDLTPLGVDKAEESAIDYIESVRDDNNTQIDQLLFGQAQPRCQ